MPKLTWSVATVWLVKLHDVVLALLPPASESASRRRPEKGGEAGGEKRAGAGEGGGGAAEGLGRPAAGGVVVGHLYECYV